MKKLYTIIGALGIALGVNAQTQVTFYTNHGEFIVEMADELAPITSGNFIDLVNDEFYDDVIFHRVIEDFIIQGGDPTGTGSGGPGYTIEDEFHEDLSNVTGTISMANTGAPNSGGSQFFFNMVNNTYLDFDQPPYTSKHAVFGEVIDGWDVVVEISEVPVNSQDRPINEVVMDSIRVTSTSVGFFSPTANNEPRMMVYPNPTNELSYAIFNSDFKPAHIQVYDLFGKLVYSDVVTDDRYALPVSNLSTGTYMVRSFNENQETREKLIVQ